MSFYLNEAECRQHADFVTFLDVANYEPNSERDSRADIEHKGGFIRPPPKPHELDSELTAESKLFQTIHMGAAVVDKAQWRLVFDGMVERPFFITFDQLTKMPPTHIVSFHECYGSPLVAPINNVWRVGNVRWTGVRLKILLDVAIPTPSATYVWSDGLEEGVFAKVRADRYQKDLPMEKARSPEVLLAYEMNGKPLGRDRGGPVRLVVPGWFGTNSTKWICHISLQDRRSSGPFTTTFYNEIDPTDPEGKRKRPVWKVEPNSIIVRPCPNEVFQTSEVEVWGRAWGCDEISHVEISADDGRSWVNAELAPRRQFEWQIFRRTVKFDHAGSFRIKARATDRTGLQQPLAGRRNHVHTVEVELSAGRSTGSGEVKTRH